MSLWSSFAEVCARHGARTAVTLGTESVTYAELKDRSAQVAAALQALNVPAGALVAIYLERSTGLVAAMLGVIQAGAAYLPIDSSYPLTRVLETIKDALPVAVISERGLAIAGLDTPVVLMEDVSPPHGGLCDVQSGPEDLAYVIYTSGSTGKPKGVMVTHGNVMRLMSQTEAWFHFDERDVWTMFHSFAFDFSVWEMWGCLLNGGRLVLVPFAISRSPDDFYALLASEGVTVLNQTPSALSLLIQAEGRAEQRALTLRTVILGGEALNLRSLLPWFARHGDRVPEIINMYGITETTVHVTYRRIMQVDAERETESLIGEPIPDLQIHLLDEHLRPVSDGETGEICIGGPGVAAGYLHRPELTAERFIADPFCETEGRLYRSGDLARRRADGELVYLGRADRQVKVNGFRIEPGEIEAALVSFPGVIQAFATTVADENGGQRLAAYFVLDGAADEKALSAYLAQRLPSHMRPAFYTRLAALPMNVNGKVDRAALPSPVVTVASWSPTTGLTSSMESKVAAVWRQALGTGGIGAEENFFDVGGSSMLLIAVRTALQQELGRALPVTWFFEYTTIRSLAAKLSQDGIRAVAVTDEPKEKAKLQRESFARMKAARSTAR